MAKSVRAPSDSWQNPWHRLQDVSIARQNPYDDLLLHRRDIFITELAGQECITIGLASGFTPTFLHLLLDLEYLVQPAESTLATEKCGT